MARVRAGKAAVAPGRQGRPVTVAHVVFRFDYGGMENGVANLINGSDPERFRHMVIALTEVTSFSERVQPGRAEFFALGKRPGKDLGAYWRLFRHLRRNRPDIYHTRNFGTLDTVAVARAAGIRRCLHGEHGWDVHDPDGTVPKYRRVRRALAPLVTRFVTVSAELRRWLVEVVGIDAAKTEHICNGVDVQRFAPPDPGFDRGALLPGDVFPSDAVVLGAVGRFERIKDPLNLVDAFVELAASDPGDASRLRLAYIGDGALRDEALQRLRSAGVAERAWLPGSRDDVPALLGCMDLFALPSLREGISNTILEAMASGLPVIATQTGGNPELVTDGATGRLVAVGDSAALAAAIRDYAVAPELRAAHARAAREDAVSRFSLETMIHRYEALYDATAPN